MKPFDYVRSHDAAGAAEAVAQGWAHGTATAPKRRLRGLTLGRKRAEELLKLSDAESVGGMSMCAGSTTWTLTLPRPSRWMKC